MSEHFCRETVYAFLMGTIADMHVNLSVPQVCQTQKDI